MNAKDKAIRDRNEALRERFQTLDSLGVEIDPLRWDALAVDYFEAGYALNATVCFSRADAVRAAVPLPSALVEV